MSDDKVSLEFLGEQMFRVQTDLRGVRSEQVRLEDDVRGLDGKLTALDAKVNRVDAKVERVDAKLDNLTASVDARFEQVNRAMAINLDVMLKAFGTAKR